jgi:energy-coupling factor transporter ATP-binding protein EcfA2
MKIHSLTIKNFRSIEKFSIDFTNNWSQPRPLTLIVGPNGSGKTSILDAILMVVRTSENFRNLRLRDGLEFSPAQLVRGRGKDAEIQFEYSIEKEEALKINEVVKKGKIRLPLPFPENDFSIPPCGEPTMCTWKYPRYGRGKPYVLLSSPKNSAKILGARGFADQAVRNNFIERGIFEHIGSVCYLDQRRSFSLTKEDFPFKHEENHSQDDVLSWIYQYYQRDLAWDEAKYGESYWKKIQRLFNKICYPSQLIGPESGPNVMTLILKKNNVEYDISQMSSGEHQILRILVGLTAETAVNSIVLLDEVELHLHPAWQRKLIQALRDDDSNNQYILTTHSPFVKDLFFQNETISLGQLDQ